MEETFTFTSSDPTLLGWFEKTVKELSEMDRAPRIREEDLKRWNLDVLLSADGPEGVRRYPGSYLDQIAAKSRKETLMNIRSKVMIEVSQ